MWFSIIIICLVFFILGTLVGYYLLQNKLTYQKGFDDGCEYCDNGRKWSVKEEKRIRNQAISDRFLD